VANGPLAEKKAADARSQYPLTRSSSWDTWNPRSIDERQARLAKVAIAVWRLPGACHSAARKAIIMRPVK
jgi:Protein of unknown function (DUF1524)